MPFDFGIIYIVLLVTYLEGILSIDNAAVLGAMVSGLPQHDTIPWPRALRWLTQPIHRLLGGQRAAALKVGLLGAYVGRGAMLFLANFVIHNPWLRILGALYLIKLAFENLGEPEHGEDEQVDLARVTRRSFWGIVIAVELADLAFSLDNVVAVVAISDDIRLVMFGVAMGILTMRFAAGIFTKLIEREPILKPAAYVLVLNIGVELLLEEIFHLHFDEVVTFSVSLATLVLAIFYARFKPLHALQPVFYYLGQGMANLNELMNWLLQPILIPLAFLFKMLGRLFDRVFIAWEKRRTPSQEPPSADPDNPKVPFGNE